MYFMRYSACFLRYGLGAQVEKLPGPALERTFVGSFEITAKAKTPSIVK